MGTVSNLGACQQAYAIAANATQTDQCDIVGQCSKVSTVIHKISELACSNVTTLSSFDQNDTVSLAEHHSLNLICKSSDSLKDNPGVSCLKALVSDVATTLYPGSSLLGGVFGGLISSAAIGFVIFQSGVLAPKSRLVGAAQGALLGGLVGLTQSRAQAAISASILHTVPEFNMVVAQVSLGGLAVGSIVGGVIGAISNPFPVDRAQASFFIATGSGLVSSLTAGPLGGAFSSDRLEPTKNFVAQGLGAGLLGGVTFGASLLGFCYYIGRDGPAAIKSAVDKLKSAGTAGVEMATNNFKFASSEPG